MQGPLESLWSGASAAANAHLNDLVQLKLESQFDQGADELRASMRAPGGAPRWVMDGCEALFDSVYDDVRDSLVSYLMIAFGKRTGKYAEARAPNAPPAGWSSHSCCSWLRRARAWVRYTWSPCDVSYWLQLRKPSYWALLLVALCPRYGVAPLFWPAMGFQPQP